MDRCASRPVPILIYPKFAANFKTVRQNFMHRLIRCRIHKQILGAHNSIIMLKINLFDFGRTDYEEPAAVERMLRESAS